MKIYVLIVVLFVSEIFSHQSNRNGLKEQFFWGILDFKFPNVSARNMALSTGSYIPEHNNIWGIEVWKDKVFVSVFRFERGVASSLNYFSMNSATKSPLLIPYPSFDANYLNEDPQHETLTLPSKSSIICAAYFRIDKCDRMWVVDVGIIDYVGDKRLFTPPALVIFNLKTNKLVRRYTIPAAFFNPNSVLSNLDLDFPGNDCDDVFAYIVDEFRTLIVYSFKENRSWQLVHNFFGSEPHAGQFFIEGKTIQWNFGILGITVGEHQNDGSRRVYIKPFSSTKSYYISNKVLQNETYIGLNNYFYDVKLLGDLGKNGQILTWAYDEKTNVLFDTQFYRFRVTCWNTANPYRKSNFAVVSKKEQMISAADVKIDRNRNLWVLSNSLLRFQFGTWNANVKNIQIFKGKVDNLISGTVCELK